MTAVPCHLCGGALAPLEGFARLRQVTSDCRPWVGGRLAACADCGAVQKPVSASWRRQAERIYAGYQMYRQGGGAEQAVFDQGAAAPRSQNIVAWLAATGALPQRGRLLDVGCGNGALLRAFAARYPRWQLTGLELDDRNRRAVEAVPAAWHQGPVDALEGRFDLVAMIHVLEHIPDPVRYLRRLADRLAPGGLLVVQTPDLAGSPFDLLIADHCTHFTAGLLRRAAAAAGFAVAGLGDNVVAKELSLLARYRPQEAAGGAGPRPDAGAQMALGHIAWLRALRRTGAQAAGPLGLFGTSIAATWLAAALGDKVAFFVDEDANRIGRAHLDRPVYHPLRAPAHAPILVPLRPDIAAAVAARLQRPDGGFILPAPA